MLYKYGIVYCLFLAPMVRPLKGGRFSGHKHVCAFAAAKQKGTKAATKQKFTKTAVKKPVTPRMIS